MKLHTKWDTDKLTNTSVYPVLFGKPYIFSNYIFLSIIFEVTIIYKLVPFFA